MVIATTVIMGTEVEGVSRVVFQIIFRTIGITITTTTTTITKVILTKTITSTIVVVSITTMVSIITKVVVTTIIMEVVEVVITTMVVEAAVVITTTMAGEEDITIMPDIRIIMVAMEMLVLIKEVTTIQIIGNTIKLKKSKIISNNRRNGSIRPNSINIGVNKISNSKITVSIVATNLSTKLKQYLQLLSTLLKRMIPQNNI